MGRVDDSAENTLEALPPKSFLVRQTTAGVST
jgi:hypothetical protein